MELLTRVCVSWAIFVLFWEKSNSIEPLSTKSITKLNTTDPAPGDESAHYVLVPRRTAVLIINDPAAPTNMTRVSIPQALRATKMSKNDVKCLKYVEYDEKNLDVVLNTVFMYDLKDVADFFYMYLDTKICHHVCLEE